MGKNKEFFQAKNSQECLVIFLPNHFKPGFFFRGAIGKTVKAAISIITPSAFPGSKITYPGEAVLSKKSLELSLLLGH